MRLVALAVALVLAGCGGSPTAAGGTAATAVEEDLCHSAEFRSAFLEGQEGIIIDYSSPSAELVAYGDRALPCLTQIAEHGGGALSLERCSSLADSCRAWAHTAIRLIGTPRAREYLLQRLEQEQDPVWVAKTIVALGSLREQAARPQLRRLLEHEDPEVRVACITALGVIGVPGDLDAMGNALDGLPDEYVPRAVHGFKTLGDTRALGLLDRRAATLRDELARERTDKAIASWRDAIAEQDRLLTVLRSGKDWDLIEALRQIKGPVSPEARAAVLELLEHDDPLVRAESVIAVGKMHVASDFDRLLAVTLALPEPYVSNASRGLVFLNDPRAIAPLEKYAAKMKNSERQRELRGRIEQLRRQHAGR